MLFAKTRVCNCMSFDNILCWSVTKRRNRYDDGRVKCPYLYIFDEEIFPRIEQSERLFVSFVKVVGSVVRRVELVKMIE